MNYNVELLCMIQLQRVAVECLELGMAIARRDTGVDVPAEYSRLRQLLHQSEAEFRRSLGSTAATVTPLPEPTSAEIARAEKLGIEMAVKAMGFPAVPAARCSCEATGRHSECPVHGLEPFDGVTPADMANPTTALLAASVAHEQAKKVGGGE